MKKDCKKQIKKNSELKRKSKQNVIKYIANGKDMVIHIILSGLVKKDLVSI